MSETSAQPATSTEPAPDDRRDGVSLVRAVMSNWLGELVVIAAGFIVPRLISDRTGQEVLGVWDFGWMLVAYTQLLLLGVTSAVSRYVSRYRTVGDQDGLNRIVSACVAVLSGSFVLACGMVAAFAFGVEWFIRDTDPAHVALARQIIWILGLASAIDLPLSALSGIISGCKREDIKNMIRGGCQIGASVAMVAVLLAGGGIRTLAWVILAQICLTGLLNWVAAMRLCPELRIRPSLLQWAMVKETLAFSGKTALLQATRTIAYQTNGMLIGYFLGLGPLALYARQRTLVFHLTKVLHMYAHVFVPRSSALHALSDNEGLKRLMLRSMTYAALITFPAVLFLAIMGGPILQLWMGQEYEQALVLGIMAIGHVPMLTQTGALATLMGMGRHGMAAFIGVPATLASIGLSALFLGPLKLGLVGAAVALVVPLAAVHALFLPVLICRYLHMPLREYLGAFALPLRLAAPFAAVLMVVRVLPIPSPLAVVALGTLVAGTLYLVLTWKWMAPMLRRGSTEAVPVAS